MKKPLIAVAIVILAVHAAKGQEQPDVFILTDVIPMEYMGLSPALRDLPPETFSEVPTGKPIDREDREHEREARSACTGWGTGTPCRRAGIPCCRPPHPSMIKDGRWT
jgi:hypothetical protein